MNERIEIEVKYSPDEYVRGMIFSQRKNSFHKYNFFFTFVSGLIGFIGVHYFINRGEIILNSDFLLKFLFVLMILIPVAYVFKDFSPASERFFKKHYDSTALLQETYKISFDAEGINSESKSFTSKLG